MQDFKTAKWGAKVADSKGKRHGMVYCNAQIQSAVGKIFTRADID